MGKENFDGIEKIIEKYQHQLVRFAFFRIGSNADAQDIVQNVFIKFFERKLDLKSLRNPRSFLFKSIYNACIDFQRTPVLKTLHIDSIPELQNRADADNSEQKSEFKRISRLLKDLPEEQAEIIRLRVIDGLGFNEIAEITGIPVPTAKSRFRYGIEKLRTLLNVKTEVSHELYRF